MSTPGPVEQDGRTPQRFAPPPLLTELVTNTLDGGYRTAAQRRGVNAAPRWYDRPLVVLGCLIAGLITAVAYVQTHRSAPAAAKVHSGLVTRVRDAQHAGDRLQDRIDALQRQLAAERDAALPQNGVLAGQLRRDQLLAGQVAVRGPGMTVTLKEPKAKTASAAPGRGGSVPITSTNILSDRDVRSVVNELWHDGAEAIGVNGIRLTPTSAIRFAGEAVLVDFQPITSPYRITAIGDTDGLSTSFAQSSVASRYQTLKGVDKIGFSFGESDHLELPAGAPATVRRATPARGTR